MDYTQLATAIMPLVGGVANVTGATHCATRLRLTLKEDKLAKDDRIKELDGVLGVARAGGQYQIIIGQEVAHVFDAFEVLRHSESTSVVQTNDKPSAPAKKSQNWLDRLLDTITGIFTPILPAITGAAMIKTLLIILTLVHLMSTKSQTYYIFSFVGDTAFSFLPVLLAYSAAKKFKLNPYLGMVMGAMLLHPNWTALIATNKPIHLFDILPVTPATYTSTVIPIILIIWLASYVDRFAETISPKSIKFFLQPLITLFVMVPVAFVFVGPLGYLVGKGLGVAITAIQGHAIWLIPLLFGTIAPLCIMTGMHYAVTIPLAITSMTTNGFDMLGIGYLVANIAQGAATLAVAQKSKDTKVRALASSAGVTALLGVTEPALYGVTLRYKKPFIAVLIGGAIGGLIGGIFNVKRLTYAPTGLTTLPIFIDPKNGANIVWAIIAAVVAFVVSYLVTLFMIKTDEHLKKEIGA